MSQYALVTDIGGTNARFALFNLITSELSSITKVVITQDDILLMLIKGYLEQQNVIVDTACIAIACPIDGDRVTMTNNNLTFSQSELIKELKLNKLLVINDFTAVSASIPRLSTQDVVKIGGQTPDSNYPIAVYGAGTGLGVSFMVKCDQDYITLSGEGGHVEFPMINHKEDMILEQLRNKFGRVSAERFLSGKGIVNIYQALLNIHHEKINSCETNATVDSAHIEDIKPETIVNKALNKECPICTETLTLFCTFMGRFGGNLALSLNTQAGVYIAGGIVPRFIDFFKASPFREAFENKGRMSYLVKKIPVYVITHPDPGLFGAGVYLQNRL